MADPYALFEAAVGAAVLALEGAAALVILVAGARALVAFARSLLRHAPGTRPERRRFADGLLLALDFTIGADVLKLAIRPSFESALLVGAVVLVRTVLTLVLEYELRKASARDEAGG